MPSASSLLLRDPASLWPLLPETLAETQGPERDVAPWLRVGRWGTCDSLGIPGGTLGACLPVLGQGQVQLRERWGLRQGPGCGPTGSHISPDSGTAVLNLGPALDRSGSYKKCGLDVTVRFWCAAKVRSQGLRPRITSLPSCWALTPQDSLLT